MVSISSRMLDCTTKNLLSKEIFFVTHFIFFIPTISISNRKLFLKIYFCFCCSSSTISVNLQLAMPQSGMNELSVESKIGYFFDIDNSMPGV